MKKIMFFLMAALLALSVAGCGGNQPANGMQGKDDSGTKQQTAEQPKSGLDEIKARGEIIVGLSADYPPYESHEMINGEDKIVGFDVDLAEALAKELGVKLKIVDTSYNGLIPMLESNKIDIIISGMSITPKRAESVDFSDSYYSGQNILLIKKDSDIASLDDLKDKTVGVQLGSIQETGAQKAGLETKAINLITDAVMELKNGKVDAVLVAKVVGDKFLDINDDLKGVYIEELSVDGDLAAAMKKGDKDLTGAVNKMLKDLKDSGEYDKLINKWFGA